MPQKPFNKGDKIEVRDGLFTWKPAAIVRFSSATKMRVQYQTLTETGADHTSSLLEDTVSIDDVRPAPLTELHRYFIVSEQVEAYCTERNGWRKSRIVEILENSVYAVSFEEEDSVVQVEHWRLRPVRQWCSGAWDPPFYLQEVLQKPSEPEVKSNGWKLKIKFGGKASKENFDKGMVVEIKGEEDGFRGSWYDAVIVEKLENDKFLVEYQTLTTEDKTELVKEEVPVSSIRPPPPFIQHIEPFGFFEQVDAWYNDGWWEGYVAKLMSGCNYMVHFTHSGEEMMFEHGKLRPHQEWNDGKWSIASKVNLTDGRSKRSRVESKRKYSRRSSKPKFSDGMMVEVKSDEEGYQGAWFCAVIVGSSGEDFLVEYQTLKTDDDSALLREKICASTMRPCPPKLVRVDRYSLLDEVDAWYNDGWWVGHVSSVLDGLRYAVYFWTTNEELIFEHCSLRPHQEWIGGKWTVSRRKRPKLVKDRLGNIEEQNCGTGVKIEEQNCGMRVRQEFVNGMKVEVKSDQEGYVGSWYQATIVKQLGIEMYLIEYQTLETEDGRELLKEEAHYSCIRPCPPIVLKENEYKYCEEVDAWYNDGWWVGRISEILGGCKYLVFFNSTHEIMEFNSSDLRPHQDWNNGQWFMAKV